MAGDGEYMKTFQYTECRDCGSTWYSGDENLKLEPGEEFTILRLRVYQNRCKFCRDDARGRGIHNRSR